MVGDGIVEAVQEASDEAIWNSFGKEIQDEAGDAELDYVAIVLNVSSFSCDSVDEMDKRIGVGLSMEAGSRDYLDDLFSDRFEHYIILRGTRSGAVVDIVRDRVLKALQDE